MNLPMRPPDAGIRATDRTAGTFRSPAPEDRMHPIGASPRPLRRRALGTRCWAGSVRAGSVGRGEMMSSNFAAALAHLEQSGDRPEEFSTPFVEFLPISGAAVSTLGDVFGSETLS